MRVRVNTNTSGGKKRGRSTAAVKAETHTAGILTCTHTHTHNETAIPGSIFHRLHTVFLFFLVNYEKEGRRLVSESELSTHQDYF